ncbi:Crp/Fnr family transcriptional regulator [Chitinophaga vietnamensis]|uniref:Crp/Fnr family transcriptional regulator n=1 Tax=Chitinophaga vietnamensis TaxID=2593957 RepID=UPI001178AE9F|nr:Crp/Fnr family transcriptional regulator [Chitinophaga vietnamensis]
MFEVFRQYLLSKAAFTPEELAQIEEKSVVKKLRRKQYLLQEGHLWKHYAFVCKGCLRTYQVDDKGVEHIFRFSPEHWWAGDRESLINGTPSTSNIDALEDSVLLLFTRDDFDALRRSIPAMEEVVNTLLSRSYMAANKRIQSAISRSTEERYKEFIEQYPDLLNRIPLHMIASYLGVTAETLSRIRARNVS